MQEATGEVNGVEGRTLRAIETCTGCVSMNILWDRCSSSKTVLVRVRGWTIETVDETGDCVILISRACKGR